MQRNGYDCGVFVCANGNVLSRGGRLSLHEVDRSSGDKKNEHVGPRRDRFGTMFTTDSNANALEKGGSILSDLYSLSLSGKKKTETKKMELPYTGEAMANFRYRIALDIANKKVI